VDQAELENRVAKPRSLEKFDQTMLVCLRYAAR